MSKCVFCHESTGHGDTCPMSIPTDWIMGAIQPDTPETLSQEGETSHSPRRTVPHPGPWRDLARTLLEAWQRDSSVYDRGTPENEAKLEELWGDLDRALVQGYAERAMALLFTYYNPEPTAQAHAPRHRTPT